jgi:succinate dehydrogenase hydrophobic membrane anchor protein
MKNIDFLDSLKKAKGYGQAKGGLENWGIMRVSSVFLIVLTLWFFSAFVSDLRVASRSDFVIWLRHPWHAVWLSILLLVAGIHSNYGLSEIIKDYIHTPFVKIFMLLSLKFLHLFSVFLGVFCILTAVFRG